MLTPSNSLRSNPFSCPSGRRSGFTLVEIMIVVLVMGILLAVAVPKYQRSVALYQTRLAAWHIAHDLRLASTLSEARGTAVKIEFLTSTSPDGSRYWASDLNLTLLNTPLIDTDLKQDPYHVDIVSAPSVASFNAYGLAEARYDVVVQHTTGYQYRVTVASGTNQVEVTRER